MAIIGEIVRQLRHSDGRVITLIERKSPKKVVGSSSVSGHYAFVDQPEIEASETINEHQFTQSLGAALMVLATSEEQGGFGLSARLLQNADEIQRQADHLATLPVPRKSHLLLGLERLDDGNRVVLRLEDCDGTCDKLKRK